MNSVRKRESFLSLASEADNSSATPKSSKRKERFAKIRSIKIRRPKNRRYLKFSYRWHRRIGLLISLPILIVAITGIVLNHAKSLAIDTVYIRNSYILSLYGMTPSMPIVSLKSDGLNFATLEGVLYIDGVMASDSVGTLRGAAKLDDTLLVATDKFLFLFTASDRILIEKMDQASLPSGEILRLGVKNSRVLLDTKHGQFSSSADLAEFREDIRSVLPDLEQSSLPTEFESKILEDWRGRGVSLWRLILDLHSGNLFGASGTFVADLLAASLLLLVASGYYNSRRRQKS
jgi:hypothetical protein